MKRLLFFISLLIAVSASAQNYSTNRGSSVNGSGVNNPGVCLTLRHTDGTTAQQWCPTGTGTTAFKNNSGTSIVTIGSAGTITSAIASGSNGFALSTNGARLDVGTGANDYFTSDGVGISAAGQFGVGGLFTTFSGVFTRSGSAPYTPAANSDGSIIANDGAGNSSPALRLYVAASDNMAIDATQSAGLRFHYKLAETGATQVATLSNAGALATIGTISSTIASGSNAFQIGTTGGRLKMSSGGGSDYMTGDGATITAAGALDVTGALVASGGITISASSSPISAAPGASAAIDVASVTAQTCLDTSQSVPNVAVGGACVVGPPAAPTDNLSFTCYVSASGTVQLRACNPTAGNIDPASATYYFRVFNP